MIVWGWWTRGAESTSTAVAAGPQWAYGTQGRSHRVFPPRTRGTDTWIQTGDLRDPDPALDTWEGEAT